MECALVVACTNGKSSRPAARLGRIRRRIRGATTKSVFEAWSMELDDRVEGRVRADELYSGVAWAAARAVGDAVRRLSPDAGCWVLSAGYGLIHWDQLLLPYAATFSPGHVDSVGAQDPDAYRETNAQWWHYLTAWRPQGHEGPRSFRTLATVVDRAMIVMSPRYLDAAADDIAKAAASLSSCVVVSGGLRPTHPLAEYSIPFDKRLREAESVTGAERLLDASDMSLNQRLAEHLVVELGADAFDLQEARRYVRAAMQSRRPPRSYKHRVSASDEEVAAFVESALLEDPEAAKTPLLRAWRQQGRQCEQKRFGRIYEETRTAIELAQLRTTPLETST